LPAQKTSEQDKDTERAENHGIWENEVYSNKKMSQNEKAIIIVLESVKDAIPQ